MYYIYSAENRTGLFNKSSVQAVHFVGNTEV